MYLKGVNGMYHTESFVNGKNVYIDHKTIHKSLRLESNTLQPPCINIYEKIVFNKNEFELHVSLFSDSDVSLRLCDSNWGINFVHFTSTYQQATFILRTNLLHKPKQDQIFHFVELKVMFQLVTNKVDINLCYILVLNMINGFHMISCRMVFF